MRLQSETIIALILLIAGALATIIIYNIIYPNLNIINPSGQEISRSLELNFQLLDYFIANNTLYAYVKPSEPVNYSQVFAIVNNRLVNVYPYNSNGSIVNPYNNGLLIVVANLSQIPPDQNGNYQLEVGLENDILGIFTIKYISNTLINYFQPPIIFNISNSTSSTPTTPTCPSPYLPLILYNTQSISTPSPFQQDIAICNGSINIGPNFAYVNNATLFNEINSNGSNVYFTTTCNSTPNIYSWYEGQLINGSTYCNVWWINLSNGIPANSNVTIYMYIGNSSSNYYRQYYPYVGASPQVISGYDNGNYTFIAYGYFNNTTDGWNGYTYSGSWSPTATPNGIEMTNGNSQQCGGTYILPPNNWNIPKIPLIVEEAWYFNSSKTKVKGVTYVGTGGSIISLFGNTSNQISGPTSNLSTYADFYYNPSSGGVYLDTAITGSSQTLNSTSFPFQSDTVYGYLFINSTYAQTGYYIYNTNQVWIPLTILNTFSTYNNGYTYASLNYNPYQYPTLELSGSCSTSLASSNLYIEWAIARAYPPNGVMPSIYIG
ncbi:MAG: hypothetical protein GU343_01475 [Nanoarchaeota archaeon]|jgi:hypothetical protein|nr:hypothetical protein [Nanoarchaeota archaeon]